MMPEGLYITRIEWNHLVKKIDYLESYVKNSAKERNKSKWMTPAEAMEEIGCKSRKLQELRFKGKLEYKYGGKNRLVMILRKSVEDYNMMNSTIR